MPARSRTGVHWWACPFGFQIKLFGNGLQAHDRRGRPRELHDDEVARHGGMWTAPGRGCGWMTRRSRWADRWTRPIPATEPDVGVLPLVAMVAGRQELLPARA